VCFLTEFRIRAGVPTLEFTSTETTTPTMTETPTITGTATTAGTPTATAIPTEPAPEALQNATYVYDGDGNLVKSVINNKSTYFLGKLYQKKIDGATTIVQKYYSSGSAQIAVRTVSGATDTIQWMLSDHLGSTSTTANADGTWNSSIRYSAFGEIRASSGITNSNFRYTGQLRQAELGLYYYVARWYDPQTAHFTQADSIVPNAGDAASYDRYTYVRNNPIRFTDPSGHDVGCAGTEASNCKGMNNVVNRGLGYVINPRVNWILNFTLTNMIGNANSPTIKEIAILNRSVQTLLNGSSIDSQSKAGAVIPKANAYKKLYEKVDYGKEWDYKDKIKNLDTKLDNDGNDTVQKVRKNKYSYDTWSNIIFGYEGAAGDFSLNELQEGAGLAQYKYNFTHNKALTIDNSVNGFKKYDPPSDREGIKIGYDLCQGYLEMS
jgi:RHS repeat-associated protein